jgi:hypothetical protein
LTATRIFQQRFVRFAGIYQLFTACIKKLKINANNGENYVMLCRTIVISNGKHAEKPVCILELPWVRYVNRTNFIIMWHNNNNKKKIYFKNRKSESKTGTI